MKTINAFAALVLAVLVTACGGGGSGNAGTSPFFADSAASAVSGGTGTGTTGGAATPVAAADLVLELSKSTIANTGSDSVTATVTAVNAARVALGGATVQLTVDGDAILSAGGTVTGTNGQLQSTVTIGSNKANRTLTVKAISGSVTRTATVQVIGAKLSATLVPAVVAPGTAGAVQFRLLDQVGGAMVNQEIKVVAPSLTPAEATGRTGINGDYEFRFVAPSTPGVYPINASAGGATLEPPPTLQVQAVSTVPTVSVPITSASVSANPSVVGVNALGSTSNRSEIRALFLTSNNQPVRNVRVRFDLAGDANSIGGTFSTGTATLYSDANGVATTAYIPGSRSSPTDGVTVRACYYLNDAAGPCTSANSAQVTLTATSEPLGVSIGTNEEVIVNELTYVKKFIVSVVDSAGAAKADVNLVASLDLPQYRKGFYTRPGDTWVQTQTAVCSNEDGNRNGVLETGEDVNGTNRLDPGKSDVSVSLLQSRTRADGTAELQIQYAKSFGSWVDALITVAASGVLGTEGRASYFVAPVRVDSASLAAETPPAYVRSPFGTAPSCTDRN